MFNFFSFSLALISVLYEFTLAQIITLFHGNTFTIYAITIGLYTFSLGFGALFFESTKKTRPVKTLLITELLLSSTALLAPFLIILSSATNLATLSPKFMYLLVFSPILICGFLSGIELPSLFCLNKNQRGSILLWDYVGMFSGILFFGLYALEKFGPLKLIWGMGITNALLAWAVHEHTKIKLGPYFYLIMSSLIITGTLFITKEDFIYSYFRAVYAF